MSIEVGAIVEGTVTGITNFGAFVELASGKTGLVHISEIADVYVKDIKDFLKENDKVKVKVLSVDTNGKIGLSIKQANPRPHRDEQRRIDWQKASQMSFEDRLAKFMKESDEKQQELKRSTEAKRGGRGGHSRGTSK